MTTKPKYRSNAFGAIHSTVAGMFRAGTIDKETTRGFDDSCLLPDGIAGETQIASGNDNQRGNDKGKSEGKGRNRSLRE